MSIDRIDDGGGNSAVLAMDQGQRCGRPSMLSDAWRFIHGDAESMPFPRHSIRKRLSSATTPERNQAFG